MSRRRPHDPTKRLLPYSIVMESSDIFSSMYLDNDTLMIYINHRNVSERRNT